MEKDLNITSPEELRAAVPDVQVHGDPGFWICIAKASSQAKGWMHSTKVALIRGQGLLLQTSSEIASSQGGPRASSQALQYIPGVYLEGVTVEGQLIYQIKSSNAFDHPPGSHYLDGRRVFGKGEKPEGL